MTYPDAVNRRARIMAAKKRVGHYGPVPCPDCGLPMTDDLRQWCNRCHANRVEEQRRKDESR